jgi:inosine-uridine nucleoside N-ribohydrolase
MGSSRLQLPTTFWVDADLGIDDALAIAWLLRRPQAEIVGFSSVFGNSSVQRASTNWLTLLDACGSSVPLTVGANAPLELAHPAVLPPLFGPDALWPNGERYSLRGLSQGAPAAIAEAARRNPAMTLIALGPLTNVARAFQAYPDLMRPVRVVAYAGAARGGNITPLAEFNCYADPQALSVLLAHQATLELVTLDACERLHLDTTALARRLLSEGGRAGLLLGHVLNGYARFQERTGLPETSMGAAATAIYALHHEFGSTAPALVRVSDSDGVTRGQTVIATSPTQRAVLALGIEVLAALIAEAGAPGVEFNTLLDAVLAQHPTNAQIVTSLAAARLVDLLEDGLMEIGMERVVG